MISERTQMTGRVAQAHMLQLFCLKMETGSFGLEEHLFRLFKKSIKYALVTLMFILGLTWALF